VCACVLRDVLLVCIVIAAVAENVIALVGQRAAARAVSVRVVLACTIAVVIVICDLCVQYATDGQRCSYCTHSHLSLILHVTLLAQVFARRPSAVPAIATRPLPRAAGAAQRVFRYGARDVVLLFVYRW
jgi:hypothetical protein